MAENFPLGRDRNAVFGLDPDGSSWTAQRVTDRITHSLRILREGPQRFGPRGGGGAWPPLLIQAAQARDSWFLRNVPQSILDNMTEEMVSHPVDMVFDEDGNPVQRFARDLPSRLDHALCEEAISWPLSFLSEAPIQSDALMIYCLGKANRRFEVAPILRDRLAAATDKATRGAIAADNREAQAAIDGLNIEKPKDPVKPHAEAVVMDAMDRATIAPAERLLILQFLARTRIAKAVAREYNRKVRAFDPSNVKAIRLYREEAYGLFIERCADDGVLPEVIDPIAAAPGVCLYRWQIDRNRSRGAKAIAEALNRGEVPFRSAE